MITYNHEAYIGQAIEGVLAQKTDFPIELVIGEDWSTDNTRAISKRYQIEFPEIIRIREGGSNLGMSRNFAASLKECRGGFIALCDGDDYWIDDRKLQKQVDFLSANPEFNACYHNALIERSGKIDAGELLASPGRDVLEFQDVISHSFGYVPTSSCVIRRNSLIPFPASIPPLDWVILLLAAHNGKIKYIDEAMSVYRKHGGGWTNALNQTKVRDIIEIIMACREHFGPSTHLEFDMALSHWYADLCFVYFQSGKKTEFVSQFSEFGQLWEHLSWRTRVALRLRRFIFASPSVVWRVFAKLAI